MSYLVLARKYRPQDFSQMVGQEPVVQVLRNALSAKRLHHGYFFTGTRGVGKTTVSRILARALNCTGPDGLGDVTPDPCGVCEACQSIAAGRFVDYTELDAASNRSVAEMQALLEQAVYKPVLGRFKIFMIDEVHMLSTHAFNALLKTLEEPPDYLKFVLATTDAQKVPVTVLSRCLQFNLRAMPPDTIVAQLKKVLEAEGLPFEVAALWRLARAAKGSMRDALSITDRAIAYGAGSVQEAAVRAMLGEVDTGTALGLLQALAEHDYASLSQHIDQLRAHSGSAAGLLEEMLAVLQQVAMLQWGGAGAQAELDANLQALPQEQQSMQVLSTTLSKDEVQFLYSIVLQGRQDLGLAPDEYAACFMVLLRFWAFRDPDAALAPEKKNTPAREPQLSRAAQAQVSQAGQANPVRQTEQAHQADQADQVHAASVARPVDAEHVQPATDTAAEQARSAIKPESSSAPALASTPAVLDSPVTGLPQAPVERQLLALPVREMPAANGRTERRITAEAPSEAHQQWLSWLGARLALPTLQGMLREVALHAQCLEWTAVHMRLRVEQQVLASESLHHKMALWLQQQGLDLALVLETGPVEDSLAKQHKAQWERRREQARQTFMEHPFVVALHEEFEARWLEPLFVLQDLPPDQAAAQEAPKPPVLEP